MGSDMKKNAFSLLELAVVLTIMSLFLAMVVGGKALLENAKVKKFIDELYSFQDSFSTFYSIENRFPGDKNGDGFVGIAFTNLDYEDKEGDADAKQQKLIYEPKTSSFGGIYSGKTVDFQSGSWVDMYLAGTSKFKPVAGSNLASACWSYDCIKKNVPKVKSLEDTFVNTFMTVYNFYMGDSTDNFYNIQNGVYIDFIFIANPSSSSTGIDPLILENIDLKIDDGKYNGGKMRSVCNGATSGSIATYEKSHDLGKTCGEFNFKIYDLEI